MLGEVRNTPDDPRYKKVAEVINLLGSAAEEQILKELATDSPEMAKKLREMMFTFEDMLALSNTDMRKVLMSIDTQILAMAMKTASEELKEKVFSNLSKRATETLTEEMELLGPKPLSQVKTAQQQIVEVVRKMDAGSEINIRGSKYE
jgi:flagellar motor switch protein FliG